MFPQQITASLLLLFCAATRVWTGAQNGLWSNPANWQGGIVPTHLDSLEFPADASVREMVNDLSGREYGSLTFKGGQYTLGGNRLPLLGDIISIPGNSTNRVGGVFVGAPMKIVCSGYFNLLEIGGIEVAYPLRLETGSWIQISGGILVHEDIAVTVAAPGKVSFGPSGEIRGTVVLETGTLELAEAGDQPNIRGLLVVGDGSDDNTARVRWNMSNKLDRNSEVVLNRSGLLEMNIHSDTIRMLSGSGTVALNGGRLTVSSLGGQAEFAGELRGNGTVQVEGFDGGFALDGHHSLTGAVQFATRRVTNNFPQLGMVVSEFPTHAIFSGSLSNAAVTVTDLATLSGSGVAKSLTTTNAIVRPGPGTLRFLEGLTLDADTLLDAVLDGPDAGSVQAGTVNLNQAALRVTYQGLGESNEFALITANAATTGSAFQNFSEGAWLLAGDPATPSEFQLTYAGGGGHDVVLYCAGLFLPPVLRIEALSPTTRRLAWPRTAQGYTLQRTPTLHPQLWTTTDLPAPDIAGEEFQVLDASNSGNFFRLVR